MLQTLLTLWCWLAQLAVAFLAIDGRPSRPSDTVFVYVYKLPERFTEIPEALPARQGIHREDYDTDWHIYQHILHSPVRTQYPVQAKLFYIPVILGRQHHHSKFHDPPEGFIRHLDKAVEACDELLSEAVRWVRTELPFFNRSNGADHLVTFPNDHVTPY